MTNRQTAGTTRETTVGNQRALFVEVFALQVRSGVEHLLHTGATFGTLVADYYHVASFNLVTQNTVHCLLLRLIHASRALEVEQSLVHTCGFDDTAIFGDVAEQHTQTSVVEVCVLEVADATLLAVGVKLLVVVVVLAKTDVEQAAGGAQEVATSLVGEVLTCDVVGIEVGSKGGVVNATYRSVEHSAASQQTQNCCNTACTVYILDVICRVGRHLAQHWYTAAQRVNVFHCKVNSCLTSNSQQVEYGV